jgi:hypothetical protein
VQDEGERIQNLAPREDAAEIVLGRRTLQLKHAPDAVHPDQDQVPRAVVILVQKLDQHVETTGAHEHLQRQRRGLVHLAHKSSSFETDVARVLPGSEFRDDGDAAHETEILLQFDVVENDLPRVRYV